MRSFWSVSFSIFLFLFVVLATSDLQSDRTQRQIPSLVQGVKDFGLLVGAFGNVKYLPLLASPDSPGSVDAFLQDGILNFIDHAKRY